ncbi:MAG: STAS domain-containing protein [Anaerolineae bacterium]|nr:STAS domain-containing protein [Anaerolineae bacterium]
MDILYQALEADITLVRLNGRLDATTSPEVRAVLQKLLVKEQPKIIIDLQEVPFIDSSGLASLVSGLRLAREKDGVIALSGIQSQAQTVFRLTMLDRIFPIHPTYNDAKQSLI